MFIYVEAVFCAPFASFHEKRASKIFLLLLFSFFRKPVPCSYGEDSIQQLNGLEKVRLQESLAGSILHFHAQLMDLCNRFVTY